jgi:hypothetical protein
MIGLTLPTTGVILAKLAGLIDLTVPAAFAAA